jgi:hypothetical protein
LFAYEKQIEAIAAVTHARAHQKSRFGSRAPMKTKHPPGPAMMLGNMRDHFAQNAV